MTDDEPTKYKAQVYDAALAAFFKLRQFDSDSLDRPRAEVGWDIAEALVTAAVSGVTYKSRDRQRWFEAASLLRHFADRLEEDGLASLAWGHAGPLDARQAWRPDIRTPEGVAELDVRADAVIEGFMRPLRALTVPDKRTIVCMAFARMALEHVGDLLNEHPDEAAALSAYSRAALAPHLARIDSK